MEHTKIHGNLIIFFTKKIVAKISIQNGIISSSADYGLYHGTSDIATITSDGMVLQGDITAQIYIVLALIISM